MKNFSFSAVAFFFFCLGLGLFVSGCNVPLQSEGAFGVTSNGDDSCRTTIDMCFVEFKIRYAGEFEVRNMTAGNSDPYLVTVTVFDHMPPDDTDESTEEEIDPPESLGVIYKNFLFPGDFDKTSLPTEPEMVVEMDVLITKWNERAGEYQPTGEHACSESKTFDPCQVVP